MKAAIIEDDLLHADLLEKYLLEWSNAKNILLEIDKYKNAESFLFEWEPGLGFDVLFIDIRMQEINGMEMAKSVRKKDSGINIIFTTGITGYMEEGYEVEAMHYLLKPVDNKKLERVLQRAVIKIEKSTQEFIIASKERQTIKLFLDDIYYFEIKGRLINVHGIKDIFTYYEKIGVLEESLKDKGFFRCHKSYLINLKYVDAYNRQEAILENGEKIVISKRRYEKFCKAVLGVMIKNGGII